MADNHPAKIAKYLLKGWCLLNEYCPNGQNVPLVRSREGQVVCVCGDPTCRYHQAEDGVVCKPTESPRAEAREATETEPSSAPRPFSPPQRSDPVDRNQSDPPAVRRSPSPLSSNSEKVFTTPETKFNCVRLDSVSGGQIVRLHGDSYVVKVRVGIAASSAVDGLDGALQKTVSKFCNHLANRVLIPRSSPGLDIATSTGHVTVTYGNASHYTFPETECVTLTGVTLELIAKWLLERVHGELGERGAQWMEVSLSCSLGEVSTRT